ncbi:Rtf2 RING-finger-domain-containing protein [Xylaria arbuscula]|nr:Rtf2 RING-finger-domain-containing protein [Xylaria arbuscula]
MGNDGGSIPKRRELVKEAARLPTTSELKATAHESLSHAWSTCPISSQPLDPHNTVSDARGHLYNYETILRCLMPGSASDTNESPEESRGQEAAAFARTGIRSLKDVVKLRFHLTTQKRKNEEEEEIRTCPLSMKELGASTRAVYLVPCGHVFTEIVMRELLAAEESNPATPADVHPPDKTTRHCPECSEAFLQRDLVPILPVDEADIDKCTARIEALRAAGLTHNLKKDKSAAGGKKKRKAGAEEEKEKEKDDKIASKTTGGNVVNGGSTKSAPKEKKQKRDRDDISSRINNAMTARVTGKVLLELQEERRKQKLAAAAR